MRELDEQRIKDLIIEQVNNHYPQAIIGRTFNLKWLANWVNEAPLEHLRDNIYTLDINENNNPMELDIDAVSEYAIAGDDLVVYMEQDDTFLLQSLGQGGVFYIDLDARTIECKGEDQIELENYLDPNPHVSSDVIEYIYQRDSVDYYVVDWDTNLSNISAYEYTDEERSDGIDRDHALEIARYRDGEIDLDYIEPVGSLTIEPFKINF